MTLNVNDVRTAEIRAFYQGIMTSLLVLRPRLKQVSTAEWRETVIDVAKHDGGFMTPSEHDQCCKYFFED